MRNNAHHHVSLTLIRKYHTLGIETLNVAGMIKAGLQSRALSDAGMSRLLDQIQYKANWYGTRVIEADQWYPSSKTCSGCGVRITRPQVYRVVREMLPRERFGPEELLLWLEDTQLRNERARRSHQRRRSARREGRMEPPP